MSEAFISSCKTALNNLIASERVYDSDDPYSSFSEGILNFFPHYCQEDHSSSWCFHAKVHDVAHNGTYIRNYMHMIVPPMQESGGKPYTSKHAFTCKAQAEGFQKLLEDMAHKPQDYITPTGRMTTNAVEGFHGLALMYVTNGQTWSTSLHLQNKHGNLPQGILPRMFW